ncbi:helix-turn-helix domain-containing protein [Dyella sp.]|uniref:helix-turn-helix domain-containing protein n=1 Tax=Dyella sp. TaxID=1869338 RepID=UPI003F7FDD9C
MDKVDFIVNELRLARERAGRSLTSIAGALNIGEDWLAAVEDGKVRPSFDLVYALAECAGIDFAEIINRAKQVEGADIELARSISAEDDGAGNLTLKFQYNDHKAIYKLENARLSDYKKLLANLRVMTYDNKVSKTEFVIKSFFKAMELWPHANPSDIWGFVLSRLYQDPYNHPVTEQNRDFAQSWKRTSGWVLEEIFVRHYKDFLKSHNIEIGIYPKSQVKAQLDRMKLNYHDVQEKADVLLIDTTTSECFGVVHVKASLAERRQADQSFSEALLAKNYFSPFLTMDCKSFPSATPINKGELGPVKTKAADPRINKRLDFEEEGYFSGCFSYNSNTIPTPANQKATARVYRMDFRNPDDAFSQAAITARDRLYS